ncbi:hypothetical protein Tco_0721939 [Tanacetum coccineum]
MSNTNNTLQTQSSNALHNAIIESGGKDCPPMLSPVAEDDTETITPGHMEAYHNVPKEIREKLDAEAETV